MGLISFTVATPFFSYLNKTEYGLPVAHTDFKSVCFVDEYSDFIISSRTSSMNVDPNKVFNTFFIWTQRVDCVPSVENSLDDSLEKGDALVFINPIKSFGDEEVKVINNYLDKGGNVLVLDGISNKNSTANTACKPNQSYY